MAYKARLPKSFIKKVKKLVGTPKKRVETCILQVLSDPYSGTPLTGPLKGLWRKRTGDYRILYNITEKQKLVVFYTLDHRKRVYKK